MNIIKTINNNELKKLISVTDGIFAQRDKAMMVLLYNTGLRVSELCGLNIRDVMNGNIKHELKVRKDIAKGKRERIIPLNDKSRDAIQNLIAFNTSMGYDASPKSPLLQGRKHGRLTRQQVHYIVAELGRKANLDIDIHPHTLRHSFATIVLKKTQNLRITQMLLGHANISTTTIYTHPSRDDLSDAVAGL